MLKYSPLQLSIRGEKVWPGAEEVVANHGNENYLPNLEIEAEERASILNDLT